MFHSQKKKYLSIFLSVLLMISSFPIPTFYAEDASMVTPSPEIQETITPEAPADTTAPAEETETTAPVQPPLDPTVTAPAENEQTPPVQEESQPPADKTEEVPTPVLPQEPATDEPPSQTEGALPSAAPGTQQPPQAIAQPQVLAAPLAANVTITYLKGQGNGTPPAAQTYTNVVSPHMVKIAAGGNLSGYNSTTFYAWRDGQGNLYYPQTFIDIGQTGSLTLTAQYKKSNDLFKVQYDSNYPDNKPDSEIYVSALKDQPFTLAGAIFTHDDYYMIGWTTIPGHSEEVMYNLGQITDLNLTGIHFYAVWKKTAPPVEHVTVTFNEGDHGQLSGQSVFSNIVKNTPWGEYFDGQPGTIPVPTPDPNYYFTGWTPALPGNASLISQNMSFTATWQKKTDITLTAFSDSLVYNGLEQTLQGFSGAPVGFTFQTSGGQPLTASAEGTNVGDYPVVFNESAANIQIFDDVQNITNHCSITLVTGTLTITPATLTVKADNKTISFGNLPPVYTYSISGFQDDDEGESGVFSGTPVLTSSYVQGNPTGSYPITVDISGMTSLNYVFQGVPGTLIVGKIRVVLCEDITFKHKNYQKIYSQQDPAFGLLWSPALIAHKDDFIVSFTRQPGENVGQYIVTAHVEVVESMEDHYVIVDDASLTAKLTITPLKATIKAGNNQKNYGQPDPDPIASATITTQPVSSPIIGFVKAPLVFTLSRDPGENAGTYPIRVVFDPEDNPNYIISTTPGIFTIKKIKIVICEDITFKKDNYKKLYGQQDPNFELVWSDELAGIKDDFTVSFTREPGENVGQYVITAHIQAVPSGGMTLYGGGGSGGQGGGGQGGQGGHGGQGGQGGHGGHNDDNYIIIQDCPLTATLTITPLKATIKAGNNHKNYGQPDPDPIADATVIIQPVPSPIPGFVPDELVFTLSRDPGENAGTYPIRVVHTPQDNPNYTIHTTPGIFTVKKIKIVIGEDVTFKKKSYKKLYSQQDPVFELHWSPEFADIKDIFNVSFTREPGENVGQYLITAHIQAAPSGGMTPFGSGGGSGGSGGQGGPGGSGGGQGGHGGSGGHSEDNITIIQKWPLTATLTITPLKATIKAGNNQKNYGQPDPDPIADATVTIQPVPSPIPGFVLDELVFTLGRDPGENVGTYPIRVLHNPQDNPNYTVHTTSGLFTIKKIKIIVGTDVTFKQQNYQKLYSEQDPVFELVWSDTLAGIEDNFNVSFTREPGENVGQYIITAHIQAAPSGGMTPFGGGGSGGGQGAHGGGSGGHGGPGGHQEDNFILIQNGPLTATLTIIPLQAHIQAGDSQKDHGQSDPDPIAEATVTIQSVPSPIEGFVKDELVFTLSRDPGENAGEYVIHVVYTEEDNPNYSIDTTPGTFTIGKIRVVIGEDITFTQQDYQKLYSEQDPDFDLNWSDDLIDKKDDFSVSFTRDPGENVGQYIITAHIEVISGGGMMPFNGLEEPSDGNYIIIQDGPLTATLTITPLQAQIHGGDNQKFFGQSDPDPIAEASIIIQPVISPMEGFIKDELVFTLSRDLGENVGTYVIYVNHNEGDNPNYLIETSTGIFTINPSELPLIITLANQQKVYGDPDPTLEELLGDLTVQNLLGGDQASMLNIQIARQFGENVGTYAYYINYDEESVANYSSVQINAASLTITPAPVKVKAKDVHIKHGDPVPPFSHTMDGLRRGEKAEQVFTGQPKSTTDYKPEKGPGTYAIKTEQGTLSNLPYQLANFGGGTAQFGTFANGTFGNYSFVFEPGVLTVAPAALVTSAPGGSSSESIPSTGDSTNLLQLWFALFSLAGIGIVLFILRRKSINRSSNQ